MAQFDVFESFEPDVAPLLVDVQADLLKQLATRVVVPLALFKQQVVTPITRLNPTIEFAGADYVLLVQDLAALPITALGKRVGSVARDRSDIVAALDLLFAGA